MTKKNGLKYGLGMLGVLSLPC